jgi:arginine deiminase
MALMSEIGRLRRVLVHEPGGEVEQMTPSTARELLYNDIVPVESVRREHQELQKVLRIFAEVTDVSTVLEEIARESTGIASLAAALSGPDQLTRERLLERWHGADPQSIVDDCILGVTRRPTRVTDLYRPDSFLTPPLPNLYFTRDSSFVLHNRAYRSVMAGSVREAEAAIMSRVLAALHLEVDERLETGRRVDGTLRIEGGDVLVMDGDTLLVGVGERTSPSGVDALIEAVSAGRETPVTVVVVDLPHERATIHLDMVATVVGPDEILGYTPFLSGPRARRAYTVVAPPGYGATWTIREHHDLLSALDSVGRHCSVIPCGGDHEVTREREQWFSACNSFALAPRNVLVYRNNPRTLDALDQRGYHICEGSHVIDHPREVCDADGTVRPGPRAIAVEGVELARGGGGPRCMTLPIERDPV